MARIALFTLFLLSILALFAMTGFAANTTTSYKDEFTESAPKVLVETSSHLSDNDPIDYVENYQTEMHQHPSFKEFRGCVTCMHDCFRMNEACFTFKRCVKGCVTGWVC